MDARKCLNCMSQYGGNCEGRCRTWRTFGCDKLPPPVKPTNPRHPNHAQNRADWDHFEMHPEHYTWLSGVYMRNVT